MGEKFGAWGAHLAVGAALLCACTQQSTGALGNGQFQYLCSSSSADFACSSSSDTSVDLPSVIAVGATVQIGYAPKSNNSGGVVQGANGYEIVPASPELASASGDTILTERSGYVALLARNAGTADIDDFVHVKLSPIHSLRAMPAMLVLAAGESGSIQLAPTDAIGAELAGRIVCQWQVTTGASSITIQNSPASGAATLMALSAGAATVQATCGAASVTVPVDVTGSAAGDGGSDGASDGGSDGGTNG